MMTNKNYTDIMNLIEKDITSFEEVDVARCSMGIDWTEAISSVCYMYTGFYNVDDFLKSLE